jgi:hypothetical protein
VSTLQRKQEENCECIAYIKRDKGNFCPLFPYHPRLSFVENMPFALPSNMNCLTLLFLYLYQLDFTDKCLVTGFLDVVTVYVVL